MVVFCRYIFVLYLFFYNLYFSGHVKKVVIEEETTSGSSKVQNGPTMSSNFVLSPLVFVGKGKISAQHSSKYRFIFPKLNICYNKVYVGKH